MKRCIGKGKSMTVVACDLEGCDAKFHTASVTGMARKQAKSVGWGRVGRTKAAKHNGIAADDIADQLRGGRMVDMCPEHCPPPSTPRNRAARSAA